MSDTRKLTVKEYRVLMQELQHDLEINANQHEVKLDASYAFRRDERNIITDHNIMIYRRLGLFSEDSI